MISSHKMILIEKDSMQRKKESYFQTVSISITNPLNEYSYVTDLIPKNNLKIM